MNLPQDITLLSLAVALAGTMLLVLISLVMTLRTNARWRKECRRLDQDLALQQKSVMTMGQRILALEKRLRDSGQRTSDTDSKPYADASNLLAMGIGLDDVASRCGLSQAEVSLLDALRKRTVPPA